MAAELPRRQAVMLTALLAVLVSIVGYQYYSGGTTPSQAATGVTARQQTSAATGSVLEPVPPVKLAELKAPRPEPSSGGRNLFREKPKAPPPPPPGQVVTRP